MDYPPCVCHGHYDSWLTDLIQQLLFKNHNGCRFYPNHKNHIFDRVNTPEQFGIVPLYNDELLLKLKARLAHNFLIVMIVMLVIMVMLVMIVMIVMIETIAKVCFPRCHDIIVYIHIYT